MSDHKPDEWVPRKEIREYIQLNDLSVMPRYKGQRATLHSGEEYVKRTNIKRHNQEELSEWIKKGYDIGIVPGELSGGFVFLDLDGEEGMAFFDKIKNSPLIANCPHIKTRRGVHIHFRTTRAKTNDFQNGVELITSKVAHSPGDTHHSGEMTYEFENHIRKIPFIPEEELKKILPDYNPSESKEYDILQMLNTGARLGSRDIDCLVITNCLFADGMKKEEAAKRLYRWLEKGEQSTDHRNKFTTINIDKKLIEVYDKGNRYNYRHKPLFNKPAKRIEISLPGKGKHISTFGEEIIGTIQDKNQLFYHVTSRDVVEIGEIKSKKKRDPTYIGFVKVSPRRFVTVLERYVSPVVKYRDKEGELRSISKSIGSELSSILLVSDAIQDNLPQIERIFTIPLPILHEGKLTFLKRGFDERFNSWLHLNAPKITDPRMPLEEAKKIIADLLKEFCFKSDQDRTNAIAGMLTPFLRGLFSAFNVRVPIFFYIGNRERCGKDYLAGLTGIIYEGTPSEEPPISDSNNQRTDKGDELRKKLFSSLIGGRKRLHFSNNRGRLDNVALESWATSRTVSDRLLGKSETRIYDNELHFSLSGNVGITYTPDLAARCKFINLFFAQEDANSRKFKHPDLHKEVEENRGKILSAFYALIRNWVEKGTPGGSVPFASYNEWSKICGGIMETAGYDNPCIADEEISVGGDRETTNMKQLFELCYEKRPGVWIRKAEIIEILESDGNEFFRYLDFTKRADNVKFGLLLSKFIGRELSGIKLEIADSNKKGYRQEYIFRKVVQKTLHEEKTTTNKDENVQVGQVGHPVNQLITKKVFYIEKTGRLPNLPNLPKQEKRHTDTLIEEDIVIQEIPTEEKILDRISQSKDQRVAESVFINEFEEPVKEMIEDMKKKGDLYEMPTGFLRRA